MTACVNTCLCENCNRALTCVDCEYFPQSIGRCEYRGITECRYFKPMDDKRTEEDNETRDKPDRVPLSPD